MEDDPIIKEMEIRMQPSVESPRLVLLHFPLSAPTQDQGLTAARYKSQLNQLYLEQAVPEVSANVDPDKESSGKIIFTSTLSKNDQNTPVLSFVKNGQLHWIPVHSMLTMKPSYPDLDAQAASDTSTSNADPSEARVINMRFASVRTQRGNSYQHYQQRAAQEPWADLNIQEGGDLSSLVTAAAEDSMPAPWDKVDFEKAFSVNSEIDSPDLAPLMKKLLSKALVVNFEETVLHFQQQHGSWTSREIFSSLSYQAYYLHSRWVAKSELLFPESSHSYGLSYSTLVQVRDYLLWRFSLKPRVNKRDIQHKILLSKDSQIPTETLTALLKTLAKPLSDSPDVWELLSPGSSNLTPMPARYKESLDRQQLCWERRYRNLSPKDVFCCQ